MNCDDVLAALETGGPLQRRRARRHAAGCPRCAAVAATRCFEAAVGRHPALTRPGGAVALGSSRRWDGEPGLRNITLPPRHRRPARDSGGWQWWAAAACVVWSCRLR